MRAAARGAPLKANFFPYDKSLFVLMGAPNIKRVQDLKGKVIGTTGPGATTEVAASMVLQHHGMDPKKDVTFMTIGGAETSIVAMRNGIIHARAFNPDAAYIMKKQGFTELGVLADMGPWPWAGYSTSDAHLANRRDKLKRWTRAMVKSLQLMLTRKEETYKFAQADFTHPRDVIEGAANVCIKAIDPKNPGGATDDAMRKNIDRRSPSRSSFPRVRRWRNWSTFPCCGKFTPSCRLRDENNAAIHHLHRHGGVKRLGVIPDYKFQIADSKSGRPILEFVIWNP